MGKNQKLSERGKCAYCGNEDRLTTDHVIPRSLFNKGVPGDVPKVRACKLCNGVAKSNDDAYLRDMLIHEATVAAHPVAQDIRHGAFSRSSSRGRSQYERDATRSRVVASPSGSGLLIYEPVLPKERLRSIFIRLVHGLMIAYEHYELPTTTNFDVLHAVDPQIALEEARRLAMDTGGMVHTVQVGDGSVFWCVYCHTHSQDRPNLSMWWLRFYERAVYLVCTDMSNLSLGEF